MVRLMSKEEAIEVAHYNNYHEESAHIAGFYKAVPVQGNQAGVWAVKVYDEEGKVLGTV